MAIILRFSFSSFRFIMTLLACYLNLLHIHRENSRESRVSHFGVMGTFIPIGNITSFCKDLAYRLPLRRYPAKKSSYLLIASPQSIGLFLTPVLLKSVLGTKALDPPRAGHPRFHSPRVRLSHSDSLTLFPGKDFPSNLGHFTA
jgi:hypothetical protein